MQQVLRCFVRIVVYRATCRRRRARRAQRYSYQYTHVQRRGAGAEISLAVALVSVAMATPAESTVDAQARQMLELLARPAELMGSDALGRLDPQILTAFLQGPSD